MLAGDDGFGKGVEQQGGAVVLGPVAGDEFAVVYVGRFGCPACSGEGECVEQLVFPVVKQLQEGRCGRWVFEVVLALFGFDGSEVAHDLFFEAVELVGDDGVEGHLHAVVEGVHAVYVVVYGTFVHVPVCDGSVSEHLVRYLPHGPGSYLQLVAGQFAHQSSGESFVQTPVHFGFLAVFGHGPTPVVVAVPEGAYGLYVAEGSGVYHFHGTDVSGVEQALLSGEEYLSGAEVCLVHFVGFLHVEAQCLFAEYVLACREGLHYDGVVVYEGYGDDYGVESWVGYHVLIGGVCLGCGNHLVGSFQVRGVHVAQVGYFYAWVLEQEVQQERASRAESDDGHFGLFLLGVFRVGEYVQPGACHEHGSTAQHTEVLEEFASVYGIIFHVYSGYEKVVNLFTPKSTLFV